MAHGSILRGLITAVTAKTAAARNWEIFGNGSIYLIRDVNGIPEVEAVYSPARPSEETRLLSPDTNFQL